MAKRSKLDIIPPINRTGGRVRKAIARSVDCETKITRNESRETEEQKIAAIRRIALAEASKDNQRIVSSDSAVVYQIIQRALVMRKGGHGIRIHQKYFVNIGDALTELGAALQYRFKKRQIECTYDGEYITLYRNF